MPVKPTANGFVGRVGLGGGNATSYAGLAKVGGVARQLRRTLNKSHGSRKARATLLALTGAAVGAASKAYSNTRIKANETGTSDVGKMALGGKRTTETIAYQTGVTIATDLTDFDTIVASKSFPQPYAVDRSGYRPGKIGSLV